MNQKCEFCSLKLDVAKHLSDSQVERLKSHCASVVFNEGDIIVKQDAFSTNVAYIKSGLVKIHASVGGREHIMRIVKAPAYLCLPSTFGDKINHFSATALSPTRVCFIDVATFRRFITENGAFGYELLISMSRNELQNFQSCLNNAQKHNAGRVAETILFFANTIFESDQFILPISRQDIADLKGITRESVSRILTNLHTENIIKLEAREITILDKMRLTQISEKG